MRYLLIFFTLALVACGGEPEIANSDAEPAELFQPTADTVIPGRWPKDRAQTYVAERPWIVGANYNNRDAINQLEVWQAQDFDPEQIDEELGWAADIGMNSMRVYLHNLLWEQDSTGFLERIERYLAIADSHGISTTFVLFDSVWNPESELGEQPEPMPHTHNSGWVQSPPERQLAGDQSHFPAFKSYVQGILRHFDGDDRIYMWDLYNEPDNHNFGKFPKEAVDDKFDRVFPLLVKAFEWGREVAPSQPLTAGVWWQDFFNGADTLGRFNRFQLNNSDVISYHSYGDSSRHAALLPYLEQYGRPLVCTEYMARTNGSTFQGILPMLAEERIGAYNWGLVSGKSQTVYPWKSWEEDFTAEPETWFHDVFHPDGTPYDEEETDLIQELTAEKSSR